MKKNLKLALCVGLMFTALTGINAGAEAAAITGAAVITGAGAGVAGITGDWACACEEFPIILANRACCSGLSPLKLSI